MQLEHSFTVPVGVDDAWPVLLDIERVAPCMPGAQVDTVDGDNFTGTVKVKLGPINLTYKGKASFIEKDEAAHRAVISAQGRDARGNGTAKATVTATLADQDGQTKVDVLTDLDITGRPAQFGRGVMVDVGNKLIGQFADCLAGKLSGGTEPAGAMAPGAEGAAATPATPPGDIEPVAGPATELATEPASAETASVPTSAPAAAPTTAPTTAPTPAPTPAPTAAPVPSAPAASAPAAENAVADEPPATPAPPTPSPSPRPDVEPIDLLGSAGPAVAKRLAPILAAIVLLLIVIRLRKR